MHHPVRFVFSSCHSFMSLVLSLRVIPIFFDTTSAWELSPALDVFAPSYLYHFVLGFTENVFVYLGLVCQFFKTFQILIQPSKALRIFFLST